MATFHGRSVVVVGHQKGRGTKENMKRNFGMPHPEGYRKAIRMYELADRFGLPIFTFIDTPGAYPGIGAEERGQSEAIGAAIAAMARVRRAHRRLHHRRGRLRRRARARRRQPRARPRVRLLLGDLARGLRRHPLEGRRPRRRGGRRSSRSPRPTCSSSASSTPSSRSPPAAPTRTTTPPPPAWTAPSWPTSPSSTPSRRSSSSTTATAASAPSAPSGLDDGGPKAPQGLAGATSRVWLPSPGEAIAVAAMDPAS